MNTNIPQAYYACYVILGLYKAAMKTGQEVNRNAVIVIHQPMFYTSSQIKRKQLLLQTNSRTMLCQYI